MTCLISAFWIRCTTLFGWRRYDFVNTNQCHQCLKLQAARTPRQVHACMPETWRDYKKSVVQAWTNTVQTMYNYVQARANVLHIWCLYTHNPNLVVQTVYKQCTSSVTDLLGMLAHCLYVVCHGAPVPPENRVKFDLKPPRKVETIWIPVLNVCSPVESENRT